MSSPYGSTLVFLFERWNRSPFLDLKEKADESPTPKLGIGGFQRVALLSYVTRWSRRPWSWREASLHHICFMEMCGFKKSRWFSEERASTSSWCTWSQLWFLRSRHASRVLLATEDERKSELREKKWSSSCCDAPVSTLRQQFVRRYRSRMNSWCSLTC